MPFFSKKKKYQMGHFYFTNFFMKNDFNKSITLFSCPTLWWYYIISVTSANTVMFACHMSHLTNCRMTKSMHSWICLKFGLVFCIAVISITVLVDLVLVMDKYSISLGTFWLINTQRSWIRRILDGFFLVSFLFVCYFFGLVRWWKKKKLELVKFDRWQLTSFWWTHSVHSAKNLKSGLVWMFKILINFVCNKVRILTHFSWTCWTLRKIKTNSIPKKFFL